MDRESIIARTKQCAAIAASKTQKIGEKWPYLAAGLGAGAIALTINTVVNPDQTPTSNAAPTQVIPTPTIDRSWETAPAIKSEIPDIDPIQPTLPIPNFPTFQHGPDALLGFARIKGNNVAVCLPDSGQPNRLINCRGTLPEFNTTIPSDSESRICQGIHTPLLSSSRINGSTPEGNLFEVLCQKGNNNMNRVVRAAVLDSNGQVRIIE